MEKNWKGIGGRAGLVWFILGLSLLCRSGNALNKTDPTANVNLTPFMGWISAYYCLQNFSQSCPTKYVLGEAGWLNVTKSDGDEFCRQGCAEHTREVLRCIHYVKRDYWFVNKATVKHINDTINIGCTTSQGFNGTSLYPTSGYGKKSTSIVTSLLALLFLILFIM